MLGQRKSQNGGCIEEHGGAWTWRGGALGFDATCGTEEEEAIEAARRSSCSASAANEHMLDTSSNTDLTRCVGADLANTEPKASFIVAPA
jgi:hypothetical protein